MGGAASGKFTVKSCGKAHAWCAECRPAQAVAQRKPATPPRVYEKPCRDCGRCDLCVNIITPPGMKWCRDCERIKPLAAFADRKDTGGKRNHCMKCRNSTQEPYRCTGCRKVFQRYRGSKRAICATCRPSFTKLCQRCGAEFVGSLDQRKYCSKECQSAQLHDKLIETRKNVRLTALQAYGGKNPACACCGEGIPQFLNLDHINGGGGAHRRETGGGGFYVWLRKNGYPKGFRILCYNCNLGRQINGGICPHEET
jgi:hypothetical protein